MDRGVVFHITPSSPSSSIEETVRTVSSGWTRDAQLETHIDATFPAARLPNVRELLSQSVDASDSKERFRFSVVWTDESARQLGTVLSAVSTLCNAVQPNCFPSSSEVSVTTAVPSLKRLAVEALCKERKNGEKEKTLPQDLRELVECERARLNAVWNKELWDDEFEEKATVSLVLLAFDPDAPATGFRRVEFSMQPFARYDSAKITYESSRPAQNTEQADRDECVSKESNAFRDCIRNVWESRWGSSGGTIAYHEENSFGTKVMTFKHVTSLMQACETLLSIQDGFHLRAEITVQRVDLLEGLGLCRMVDNGNINVTWSKTVSQMQLSTLLHLVELSSSCTIGWFVSKQVQFERLEFEAFREELKVLRSNVPAPPHAETLEKFYDFCMANNDNVRNAEGQLDQDSESSTNENDKFLVKPRNATDGMGLLTGAFVISRKDNVVRLSFRCHNCDGMNSHRYHPGSDIHVLANLCPVHRAQLVAFRMDQVTCTGAKQVLLWPCRLLSYWYERDALTDCTVGHSILLPTHVAKQMFAGLRCCDMEPYGQMHTWHQMDVNRFLAEDEFDSNNEGIADILVC